MNYLKFRLVAAYFHLSLVGLLKRSPVSPALRLEISIRRKLDSSSAERKSNSKASLVRDEARE
jgi:hypothetical protein